MGTQVAAVEPVCPQTPQISPGNHLCGSAEPDDPGRSIDLYANCWVRLVYQCSRLGHCGLHAFGAFDSHPQCRVTLIVSR